MKNSLLLLMLCSSLLSMAQEEPEIYIMNVSTTDSIFPISNFRNASQNPGYDNQPYFIDNSTILYARTNKGATDIVVQDTETLISQWKYAATPGGEYSPQSIPNTKKVAAVRLDPSGLQRLYAYEENGAVSEIITDIQVAYFAFVDKNKLLATVLSDDRLDLTMIDVKQQQTDTLLINAGRSIHKIPNTNAMSYTVKNEEDKFDVFQLDLKDMESYFICELPVGIQDYTWIDELRLLIGSNASLFVYDSFGKQSWEKVADLSEYMIENITRITVSPNGKQIALVAEPKE